MGLDIESYYHFDDPERRKLFENRKDYSDVFEILCGDKNEMEREMVSDSLGCFYTEGVFGRILSYGSMMDMEYSIDILNRLYPDGEFIITGSNNTAEPDLTYFYSPANEQIVYKGYLSYWEKERFHASFASDEWLLKLGLPAR